MAKVYVDPATDILYASYYIKGLYETFGKANVKFKSSYFNTFKHNNHFFAFVLLDKKKLIKKVVVDFTDSALIDHFALEWSDIYGKINLDKTMELSDKIIPIGPSFGIQIFSLFETFWFATVNLLKAFNRIPNKRRFLSDYKTQYKRPMLLNYRNSIGKKNYVFFMASLWKQEQQTNDYRANFIEVCKEHPHIDFEGGFAPRTKNDIKGFEHFTKSSRTQIDDYLKKIKAASVVFNTPAVKGCHGWKLAEFLCMGKAIISTPLKRTLPSALQDHEHLLYTHGSKIDIRKKLDALLVNDVLRSTLENNASAYYHAYLKPEQVIKKLVDFC